MAKPVATPTNKPAPGGRIRRRSRTPRTATRPPATLGPTRRASNRLAALAGVGLLVSLWFAAQMLFGPTMVGEISDRAWGGALVAAVLVVVSSGAVLVAARRLPLTPAGLYNLGAGYLATVAFVASLARHFSGSPDAVNAIAPISLLVVLFPVLVSCPPTKAIQAGAAALVASVVAWLLAVAFGAEVPAAIMVLRVFQGEILAIPLGLLAADVVHGLGQRLEEERRLGSYELIERLGVGGMGEVWRARHSTLARPAAVKLVRPDALMVSGIDRREALLARFEREALATASLTSPHTVEVWDFGVEEDGTFFYVMELLDGIDLQDMVAKFGPLPPERAVWFLRQACRSLAEAHDRGLVHRDIKPSNLIACRRGDDVDFLKVVDFGLVTPLAGSVPDERFTRTDHAPGTPAYMAPEQARNPMEVDPRADLYALGCVAFFLMTRAHVFDGPSAYEIARQHAEEKPPAPSSRAMYPVPAELDALVARCLAKRPDDRPHDAREVLRLLTAVPFPDPWTDERALEWWAQYVPIPDPAKPPATLPETRVDP